MDVEIVLKFISPIIVGLLAAYFASHFALRKFKEEKVWDERRESYKEVIEAYEELIHWAEQVRASHCCEPVIGGDAKFDESLRKISKFGATGGLIFSTKFHDIVKESNTKILKIWFEIDDESKPDMYTEPRCGSVEFYSC